MRGVNWPRMKERAIHYTERSKEKLTFILIGWFGTHQLESRKQHGIKLKDPQMTCKRHQFSSWFYIKLCGLERQVSHATWQNLNSIFVKS